MNSLNNTLLIDEQQSRINLAACFRWFARLNMHEAVANHFSASVSADGKRRADQYVCSIIIPAGYVLAV